MVFREVTFERLFPAAPGGSGLMPTTHFGFESGGRRHYDVAVPGKPRIAPGMRVIALLETPDGFGNGGLWGWIDMQDGRIVSDSLRRHFAVFLLCVFFALVFPASAFVVFDPVHADGVAFSIAALFSAFALHALYLFAKVALVRKALVAVRDALCRRHRT